MNRTISITLAAVLVVAMVAVPRCSERLLKRERTGGKRLRSRKRVDQTR